MNSGIQFETPENVQISYQLAGPGTRFVAFFMDFLILIIVGLVLFFAALITGISLDLIGRGSGSEGSAMFIMIGLLALAFTLGNLVYFGVCELLMRGQTIGKRSMSIRVVSADGFSLDPMAVFLRTIFRVIDHIPLLYIVPLVTSKTQRLGDLVAGTIVIVDEKAELGSMRDELGGQKALDSQFRFDATSLGRARPQDVTAVEKLLERWWSLTDDQRQQLLGRIVPPLAARLQVECPPPADWYVFLRDFLAAEYRRQHRKLG
jgi:uncharacterized RDD family membrane protein YckC